MGSFSTLSHFLQEVFPNVTILLKLCNLPPPSSLRKERKETHMQELGKLGHCPDPPSSRFALEPVPNHLLRVFNFSAGPQPCAYQPACMCPISQKSASTCCLSLACVSPPHCQVICLSSLPCLLTSIQSLPTELCSLAVTKSAPASVTHELLAAETNGHFPCVVYLTSVTADMAGYCPFVRPPHLLSLLAGFSLLVSSSSASPYMLMSAFVLLTCFSFPPKALSTTYMWRTAKSMSLARSSSYFSNRLSDVSPSCLTSFSAPRWPQPNSSFCLPTWTCFLDFLSE